jgi:hypothetical protein
MKSTIASIKSLSKTQILAIVMVVLGLGLVIFFGLRSFRSFKQLQYIQESGFDEGTAELDAIRPWMTLKFVAVAYAVPQEFLFAELGIPFDRRNSNEALGELNKEFDFGKPPDKETMIIIDKVRAAIEEYRENPVPTGLEGDIRGWMSIQYISNSTGVPVEFILEKANIPDGNQYMPLFMVEDELDYPGGGRALAEAVQNALNQYGGSQ